MTDQLAGITVDSIPERPGQLLRQALQARLYGSGSGIARTMNLKATFAINGETVAIQQDNSATRLRLTGNSAWTLSGSDPKLGTLSTGTARSIDGTNIFDQQFFAADLANEAAQRRIAEAVADRIVQQLAIYFQTHAPSKS